MPKTRILGSNLIDLAFYVSYMLEYTEYCLKYTSERLRKQHPKVLTHWNSSGMPQSCSNSEQQCEDIYMY